MKTNYISIILNCFYILILLLFCLEELTNFEIRNQPLKTFVYFGVIPMSLFQVIWNPLALKSATAKVMGALIPFSVLISFMVIFLNSGMLQFLFAASAWETDLIIYENMKSSHKKIEFQLQDVGALGYNKRTVHVTYLTNLFTIVKEVPPGIETNMEWIKVDKCVGPAEPRH